VSATRQERSKRIADKRKRQILDAALEIYSRKGCTEASTSEIARAAGVSHGTVFHYFPRKRDILLALVDRYISLEPGKTLFNGVDPHDMSHLFLSLVQNRLDICFDNNKEISLIMSEIQRDPELRLIYAEQIIKPILEVNQKFYKSGAAQGIFRSIDSEIVVRTIMALFIGFTLVYKVEGDNGFLTTVNRRELAEKVADIIIHGISVQNSTTKKTEAKKQ
jgi:AcrR family transcriptional regulator